MNLVAELTEQSDSSSDPVFSRNIGVERHGDDVVGGVSGGGQGAAAFAGFVDRGQVTHSLWDVLTFHRLQPHLEGGDEEVLEKVKSRKFKMNSEAMSTRSVSVKQHIFLSI